MPSTPDSFSPDTMQVSRAVRLGSACIALALSPIARAQSPTAVGPERFVTAVHEGPAPAGAQYGVWASGADYKASFHDGFVFYPLLGEAHPHNLPLRWTTVAVTAGGELVVHAAVPPSLLESARRVEYDHGAFREVYELRADGVEQSFEFAAPLGGAGDLVVVGRVDTELACDAAGAAQQPLVFRDVGGEGVVRYGAAIVVDSAGRRGPVTTAWDGQRVELRVGAEFLASATYPVRIDPLIARVNLATGTAPVQDLDMIEAPDAGTPKRIVVYSRVFAGNDVDSYAIVTGADFTNPVMVFADVNAAWSTKGGRCSYAGDAHRWALVFERELFAPTTSSILAYFHQRDDATLNSGSSGTLSKPPGTTARKPDVGGRRPGGGANVLVVYQTDVTTTQQNTANTEAWGVLVHAVSATESSIPNTLDWFDVGTTYDREHPTLVKLSDGAPGFWIVSWQEYFSVAMPDDWDINVTRLDFAGLHQPQRYRFGNASSPWHKRYPQLAGGGGRFMLVMTYGNSAATPMVDEIHVQRFDWPDSQFDPDMGPPVIVAEDSANPNLAFPRLAFDATTRSHWAVIYRRGLTSAGDLFALRVDATCAVTESQTLFQSPTALGGATAVTFAPANGGSFPIAYATNETGAPVFGTRLFYPPGAENMPYGTACGGTIDASSPYRGSEFFTITLAGAPPGQLAVLGVSSFELWQPFSLLPAGCQLLIGDAAWAAVVTGPTGGAAVTFPLPATLPVGLMAYSQWLFLQPSGSPAYVLASGGLRSRIE